MNGNFSLTFSFPDNLMGVIIDEQSRPVHANRAAQFESQPFTFIVSSVVGQRIAARARMLARNGRTDLLFDVKSEQRWAVVNSRDPKQ